ncbi:hypothetical protein AB3X52_18575 [Nocardioides sp. DS6]|uniref:DUF3618 domain-containing protein n=1 Tax=Nocardioides eburneus TaxID=3231482 RepID=A0ABV3T398_9ACTN
MTASNEPPQADHLSRAEIRKDSLQDAADAVAGTVGEVATIVAKAVQDVVGAVGGLATELFAIRDSARKAAQEHEDADEEPTAP